MAPKIIFIGRFQEDKLSGDIRPVPWGGRNQNGLILLPTETTPLDHGMAKTYSEWTKVRRKGEIRGSTLPALLQRDKGRKPACKIKYIPLLP